MEVTIHFTAGFLMAYIGLIPPGMLNMTTLRTSLEHGLKAGTQFALGASIIVIIHSGIAVTFASYLNDHPSVIDRLRYLGIAVFLGLSYFFWKKAREKFRGEGMAKKGNFLTQGLMMSSINMLGIPFYLGISTVLERKEIITLDTPYIWFIVIGAFLGAFSLFMTYAYLADRIVSRISYIASNINYILSFLFLFLAFLVAVNMIF